MPEPHIGSRLGEGAGSQLSLAGDPTVRPLAARGALVPDSVLADRYRYYTGSS